ncbi:hypothetical protein EXE55_14415 [Burkholderia glumae]|uniref:DUF6387 family protein n=1 Tax=Burkholderia glumae TaxID=337 RepID=UPI001374538F|nr:DUF6387 family protein [Burkholderia glumae]QHP92036.1 hypothetical protein EXE55_14415 [Burkholderia glumae]
MARKPNSEYVKLTDLPDVFDITKYDVCSNWSLGMWAANLGRRIAFKNQFAEEITFGSLKHSVPDRGNKSHKDMMHQIPIDYLSDPETDPEPFDIDGDRLFNLPFSSHARRVRDLTALEYFEPYTILNDPSFEKYATDYCMIDERLRHEFAGEAFDSLEAGSSSEEESQNWADQKQAYLRLTNTREWEIIATEEDENKSESMSELFPIYTYPFALAKIDLEASDSDLIEDFIKWLREARATRNIQQAATAFTEIDMKKWAEFRVLAYIDLHLWLQTTNKSITQATLGNALYPDLYDSDRASRIQKTIPAYASSLMDPRVVRSMQAQYLKEEQDKKRQFPE